MSGLIAVHCGAGYHKDDLYAYYKKLCKTACKAAMNVLRDGGTAMEACKAAVIVLENNPTCNAGYGSNLTRSGTVECDASIMDGKTLLFGGCGAVKNVKNPIELAYALCTKQLEPLPLGLIPPSLLVGEGALQYAQSINIPTVSQEDMKSPKALQQYQKYKRLLKHSMSGENNRNNESDNSSEEDAEEVKLDTVGAVCIDRNGNVASACSSGGLSMKLPGRVGQGALYGSGVWADSFTSNAEEPSVAVCTTGCGEHLVQTQLAKEISEDLKKCSCPISGLSRSMTEKFINSRFLRNVQVKNGAALVLHVFNGEGSLLWGHSTLTMAVGYMQINDKIAKSVVSKLPDNVPNGSKINVGGMNFFLEDDKIDRQ